MPCPKYKSYHVRCKVIGVVCPLRHKKASSCGMLPVNISFVALSFDEIPTKKRGAAGEGNENINISLFMEINKHIKASLYLSLSRAFDEALSPVPLLALDDAPTTSFPLRITASLPSLLALSLSFLVGGL